MNWLDFSLKAKYIHFQKTLGGRLVVDRVILCQCFSTIILFDSVQSSCRQLYNLTVDKKAIAAFICVLFV